MRPVPAISRPWHRYKTILIAFVISLSLTLWAIPGMTQTSLASLSEAHQMVQQGREDFDAGRYTQATSSLTEAATTFEAHADWQALAATLTNLGRVQFADGDTNGALDSWEQAKDIYFNRLNDAAGIMSSQLYQAQALQDLGLYAQACQTITQAIATNPQFCTNQPLTAEDVAQLQAAPSSQLIVQGWRSLGDVLRFMGRLDESRQVLEALANQNTSVTEQETVILSLGNTFKSLGDRSRDRTLPQKFDYLPWRCQSNPYESLPTAAKEFYQQADTQYRQLTNSATVTTSTKARLNQFRLISESLVSESADTTMQPIDIANLPAGRARIYARIQIAKGQVCLHQQPETVPDWAQLTRAVEKAVEAANSLQDVRTQSYALGNLGGLYEYRAWWDQQNSRVAVKAISKSNRESWQQIALQLTDQALYLTQPGEFADLAYQWQWQRGRLLNATGDQPAATTAYEAAIKTLETVRSDLLAINSDVQFSFRDNVEPVYRELVALLLSSQSEKPNQSNLQEILGDSLFYVESLQLAELENFLQCNVETLGTVSLDRLSEQLNPPAALIDRIDQIFQNDPSTGLIYPILLKDRIALIVKRPGAAFQYYATPVEHETVEKTLTQLQAYLKDPSRTNAIRELSSQVYQWLIEPFEAELEVDSQPDSSTIKNLVFVLDGSFRNIPMSMLYDQQRKRYLLERYSIAISSGLQLLDASPQSTPLQALVGGLSEERQFGDQTFSALVNVPAELDSIQAVVPSKNLLDSDFNRSNLRSQLGSKDYSVVHMATHGSFSSDPEETFLVLSDQRLQASELNDLLRSPEQSSLIDLLVLSACETATGDKRAALGLAGLALRAGARSTLATLWQVNDASTATLMREFYAILNTNPGMTKADALREAQLSLWENTSQDWEVPFFWAPYVLVGNWL